MASRKCRDSGFCCGIAIDESCGVLLRNEGHHLPIAFAGLVACLFVLPPRSRSPVSKKWLYGKKATFSIPKDCAWILGECDFGNDDKVPSYELQLTKSTLADNS